MLEFMGENFDAILIPTGETTFGDRTFPVSQEAVNLFRTGKFGCIFITGGYNGFSRAIPGKSKSEAEDTVEYFLERGIPKDVIYSDSQSLETIGNFTFPIVHPEEGNPNLSDFKKMLVVGKEGHMWRVRDYSDLVFAEQRNKISFHTITGRHNDGLLARAYHPAIMHALEKLKDTSVESIHQFLLEKHPFYSHGWYDKSPIRRKLEMGLTGMRWLF